VSRILGFIGLMMTMGIGLYIYSGQISAVSTPGPSANPADTANIAGVKNDLISIANAERGYFASEGHYASSLDDLVAGKYITIKGERPPYVYDVSTTSSGFLVTATRTTSGAPTQLSIDETMEVH
jgi:hypothetical protein